jgi:hypothetical protein
MVALFAAAAASPPPLALGLIGIRAGGCRVIPWLHKHFLSCRSFALLLPRSIQVFLVGWFAS